MKIEAGVTTITAMEVIKRDGRREKIHFDKITTRIELLSGSLAIDPAKVAQLTIASIFDGISTSELDIIAAGHAEGMKLTHHPDYARLAARLLVSNLHKTTPSSFSECIADIAARAPGRLNKDRVQWIAERAQQLDSMIIHSRDADFDYIGFKTLERTYLITIGDAVVDRPQYMYMRVAIAIGSDMEMIERIYTNLSTHMYTHATPTLLNACCENQQLGSCFLLGTDDSASDIMQTVTDASMISKLAGGIGIHMSNVRAAGTLIKSSGGGASGIAKQLKIYNEAARTWDQGSKRLGAFAIYLEPWHGDIMAFLRLKQPQGAHTERAHDLFYALWIPDLFMKRLRAGEKWSLFSENTAPHLSSVFDGMMVCETCGRGENPYYTTHLATITAPKCGACAIRPKDVFTELYTQYEREGRALRTIDPQDIVAELIKTQSETGVPYVCYKDHVNRWSAQSNIGTIKSSNLCTEIMEYSDAKSYASCTLASINLPKYVHDGKFDFDELRRVVGDVVVALDRVIDVNKYPVDKCVDGARDYRPIGIGVQGLANTFCALGLPFLSKEAKYLDARIFETIYHAALSKSCDLAIERGKYTAFDGSPASRSLLHVDCALWHSGMSATMLDWSELRMRIVRHGLRHSLHTALMPTASTALVFGNNESFEPFQSQVYVKSTISGKYTVANMEMVGRLMKMGLWTDDVRVAVTNTGSIMDIKSIPESVRELYRTVWEMPQKELIERAAYRAPFIDQAQSLNVHLSNPTANTYRAVMMSSWQAGLKTGSYYIRTRAAKGAMKTNIVKAAAAPEENDVCPIGCDSCSS